MQKQMREFSCLLLSDVKEIVKEKKYIESNDKVNLENIIGKYVQKIKIMTSGSITSWQIDGETMETVTEFIFLVSQITV